MIFDLKEQPDRDQEIILNELDNRKEREQEFHDTRFADDSERQAKVGKFYRIAHSVKQRYENSVLNDSKRTSILEYGCGTGSLAFELSKNKKRRVTGIDISPVAIDLARIEAEKLGSPQNLDFQLMDAEDLQYPNDNFDLICGSGILHHLDIDKALSSVTSVLSANGKAVFLEPLGHNFLINIYRYFTPTIRSDDEHPLKASDLKKMGAYFGQVKTEYFYLASLAAGLYGDRPGSRWLLKALEAVDSVLLELPLIKLQAWFVVIELYEPKKVR